MAQELGIIRNARRSNEVIDIPSLRFEVDLLIGTVGVCIPWYEAQVFVTGVNSLDELNGRGCVMEEDTTEKVTFVRLK